MTLVCLMPLLTHAQQATFGSQVTIGGNMSAGVATGGGGGSPPPYLITENFEETQVWGQPLGGSQDGFDSSLIQSTNGTVNPDFSTAGLSLQGSQCFSVTANGSYGRWQMAATTNEIELVFLWRATALDTGGNSTCAEVEQSGTLQGALTIMLDGTIGVTQGGTRLQTVGTVSANTTYWLWLHWKTDGTAWGGFSTDGSVPTGNNYVAVTGGTGTTASQNVRLEKNTATGVYYFDHLLVATNGIPANP